MDNKIGKGISDNLDTNEYIADRLETEEPETEKPETEKPETEEHYKWKLSRAIEIRNNGEHTNKNETYYENTWRILSDEEKQKLDKERYFKEKSLWEEAEENNSLYMNVRERQLKLIRKQYDKIEPNSKESRESAKIRWRIKDHMLHNPQLSMITEYNIEFYTHDKGEYMFGSMQNHDNEYTGINVMISFISSYKVREIAEWFAQHRRLVYQFINEIILNDKRSSLVDLSLLKVKKIVPLQDSRLSISLKFGN